MLAIQREPIGSTHSIGEFAMRRVILLSATACSLLSHVSISAAADASGAEGPQTRKGGSGLEEVIVTARKREESVLKVPVVATVLNAQVLDDAQIIDIQGITTKVPGLLVGSSVGTVGTQISLRGIGTSALDAGIDQSVSLNIDGQQFSQGVTFRSGIFDLAQAEVLRGPQALFFGKNSPGGVIALTTADPGGSAEVIARQSYEFESEENRTELILSGPVTDTLGLRLAGSWADSAGYFNNTATAVPGQGGKDPKYRDFGGSENYIVRGTALWQPSDRLRARLKINVTRDKSKSPPQLQNVSCPFSTGPSVLGFQFIGGPIPCVQDENYELVDMDPAFFGGLNQDGSPGLRNGGVPFDEIEQHFEVLDLSYDFANGVSLTSTSTYYDNETDVSFNGTSGGAAGPAIFADNHFTREDFTQELRVESDNPGAINWMLGGFYQEADMMNRIYIGGNAAIGLPRTLAAGSHDLDISSASMFGQLRWMTFEALEIAAGVRYTDEERSDDAVSYSLATRTFADAVLPTPEIASQNWSPELTITYTPTDSLTVFGAYKQGYKSGSYSITTPFNGTDNSFDDEKVDGGELGLKSRLFDRSMFLNIAAYYYKYTGLQVGVSQPAGASGVPVLRTLNAGDSETYGIDFDAAYQVAAVPGLSTNLGVNWNKAKFESLHGVPCYGGQTIAMGCDESFDAGWIGLAGPSPRFTAQDASGEPLGRAPEWQAVGGLDYEVNLGERVALAIGASVQYSSEYSVIIGDRDDYYQDSYTKYNGYIALKDPDNSWELSLIGNNIDDVLRAGYCGNSDFQNSTVFTAFAQQYGRATNPSGKIDDVGCVVDAGRQIFLKLTIRPMGWIR
jgi:iron complex outermembrane recepter protein